MQDTIFKRAIELNETPLAQIKENEMKRYTIGLITGILLTASAFMFIGANKAPDDIGKYHASSTMDEGKVYTTIINTVNGNIYKRKSSRKGQYSVYD